MAPLRGAIIGENDWAKQTYLVISFSYTESSL